MNSNTHIPKTIDAILDEIVIRRSTGPDAIAQRFVEGTVKDTPPRKSERFGGRKS